MGNAANAAEPVRIWLEVTFFNHQTMVREVTGVGWKVSTSRRCLIIGHGVPRTEVPLDNVLCWRLLREEDR